MSIDNNDNNDNPEVVAPGVARFAKQSTDEIVADLFDEDGVLNGANLSVVILADTVASEPIDPDWYGRIPSANQTALINAVNNALMTGMIMGFNGLTPDEPSVRQMGENMPVVMEALARLIAQVKGAQH